MSNSLEKFRKINKVARFITSFVTFFCVFLVCFCVLCIILLKRAELNEKDVQYLINFLSINYRAQSRNELYAIFTIGIIIASSRIAITAFAHHYFRKVDETGHPFTSKLSSELFRLGILQFIIPSLGILFAKLAQIYFQNLFNEVYDYSYGLMTFVSLGFFYIFVSYLCKLGTQRLFEEKNKEELVNLEKADKREE